MIRRILESNSVKSLGRASVAVLAIAMVGQVGQASTSAAGLNIAIADFKRALHSVDHGKAAKERLEKEGRDRQKKLDADQAKIQKDIEDFKKQSMVLSVENRQKKEAELQERMMTFQQGLGKNQMEMQQRERALVDPIIDGMQEVLKKLVADKRLNLVLDAEQSVLFATGVSDITDELIKAYNAANKGKPLPGLK